MREIFGVSINGARCRWLASLHSGLTAILGAQMRKVDVFVEKPGGKELSEAIHKKFKALKGFLGEEPLASMEKRKQQKEVWDKIAELAAKQFASSRN